MYHQVKGTVRRYGSHAISMISQAVDSSQMSHALNLEDHKRIQKDGAVKTTYLCFNETFVKRRKLRVDPSESV